MAAHLSEKAGWHGVSATQTALHLKHHLFSIRKAEDRWYDNGVGRRWWKNGGRWCDLAVCIPLLLSLLYNKAMQSVRRWRESCGRQCNSNGVVTIAANEKRVKEGGICNR